jgi:NRPS condensation-like uncharacterized protein
MTSATQDQTLRFTEFEEAIYHLERQTGPWNIQAEIGFGGELDEDRLRSAIEQTCERHPLARVRMRTWAGEDRSYEWLVPRHLDVDPLSVVDCPDAGALDAARSELYSPSIPLDMSPPFRVALARRPEGDLAMFSVSHIAADGIGALRLLQSVTALYRGDEDPVEPLPLSEARALETHLAPSGLKEVGGRAVEGLRRVRDAIDGPARVAADGGSGSGEGFVFATRRLDAAETMKLLSDRPEGATLNDVLLAALHLTIEDWNLRHGADDVGRIGLMMPVNTRPKAWFFDVVSNFASFVTVSTGAEDRKDLRTASTAVADQTGPVLRAQRAGGLFDLVRLGRQVPVGVKRQIAQLLPLTGNRFADTAVLSNLGRVSDPPRFDAEPPSEIWFSPPCAGPVHAGVGAATCGGALHLSFRFLQRHFDHAGAEAFADLYLEDLGVG